MTKSCPKSCQGKNILLIIGGGIAAYKALDLIRRLRDQGAEVKVILTQAAQKFVSSLSAATLSGNRVMTDLFSHEEGYDVGHIRLARAADLIIIAPLTASRMAKMTQGLADDLAGAVLLAAKCPILALPAMNPAMWAHAATKRNAKVLADDGVVMLGPEWGEMAERGEAGLGRMSDVADIVARAAKLLKMVAKQERKEQVLAGCHIIVTAGPTHEPIDPVRFLANRSSGKQGYAIAEAIAKLGGDVTLISGPVSIKPPDGVNVVYVETAVDMLDAVQSALPADAAIFVAAVADWRVEVQATQKIKKQPLQKTLSLQLVQNPDILATIAKGHNRPRLVIGFAAETANLAANAAQKLASKGADWIIANDVSINQDGSSIMGGDETCWQIFSNLGVQSWPLMSKSCAAAKLGEKIADALLNHKN